MLGQWEVGGAEARQLAVYRIGIWCKEVELPKQLGVGIDKAIELVQMKSGD